jgi:hypothetical protein
VFRELTFRGKRRFIMTRLQIELPDDVASKVQREAASRGLSVPRYVTELVEREVSRGWPLWFFEEVVGGWQGELERPAQLPFEVRDEL